MEKSMLKIRPENMHIFNIHGNYFAFDVMTGVVHKINAAFAAYLSDDEGRDKSKDEKMAKRLESIRKWGAFPDETQTTPVVFFDSIYKLSIEVYHSCNMKCIYCYGMASGEYVDSREKPSFEKLSETIDYFVEDFGREAKAYEINIVGAGEPLLNFDLIKKIRAYAKEVEKRVNKKIVFWLFTNGTVFTDEIIDYLLNENQGLSISLDGPKDLHDQLRPIRNGQGSFDRIVEGIRKIQQAARGKGGVENLWVSTVITARHKNMIEVIKTLKELGIRNAQIRPIRTKAEGMTLTREDVEDLNRAYQELIDFLIEDVISGSMEHLGIVLNDRDFWGRHVLRLLDGSKIYYRCGAGKSKLTVSSNGDIFPCDISADIEPMRMGNIYDGIDDKHKKLYFDMEVSLKKTCNKCWARYFCGGGCYVAAFMHNRDVRVPDNIKCRFIKNLLELAIYFINEVRNRDLNTFKKIKRYVQVRDKIINRAYGLNEGGN